MAESLISQINTLIKTGRTAQAVRGLEAAIKKDPRNITLWLLLAQVHGRGTRRIDLVLACSKKVIKINNKDHRGWLEAARALDTMEHHDDALQHISRARKLAPKDRDVLLAFAMISANMNQFENAETALSRALEQDPTHLATRLQQAQIPMRKGDAKQARQLAENIQKDHPDNTNVYTILNGAGPWPKDDPALAYLEHTLLPRHRDQKSPLYPQLAKIVAKAKNDHADYDGAMTLLKQAKQSEPRRFDIGPYTTFVNTLTANVNKVSYLGHPGLDDTTAVLIVGMPRSGSTLLSQILDGHSQIVSAGESPALRNTLDQEKIAAHNAEQQLDLITNLSTDHRSKIATDYLNRLKTGLPDTRHIVDKRLHNFEKLGLLAACLPKVRILHTIRDPLDTCISCYMQSLPTGHEYTQDLAKLGAYYLAYRSLMDHWKTVLPNPILDVKYEDTVADKEAQARRIVDFLGLQWEPECLDYTQKTNQVRTLSKWQVRQPIYTSSVQRWRRYEGHIAPLKTALAPLYPDGFDVTD
ncbi:MAG: tetratricopeptide repeat-containing sulfotransferase family protein [Octadecabacter sp.]